jgi:glutamate synthase (NADPH/NADH) small chain
MTAIGERVMRAGEAREEAWRCLQCFDAPCTKACPAEVAVPRFIRMIRSGNWPGAAEVVRFANPMAASCGAACPDEQLCADACARGRIDRPIEIRRLHQFATEHGETARPGPGRILPPSTGAPDGRTSGAARKRSVAVVGSGPAGLACAAELRRLGIAVTLYEERAEIGGVLSRTIPEIRFPDQALKRDASWALGREITVRLNTRIESPAALRRRHGAVFLAPGLGWSGPALIGSDLAGVSTADAFLERCRRKRSRNPIGSEVVILGGGNVACDAALAVLQCAEAQGTPVPRVHLFYRRSRADMPAWPREVRAVEERGVSLHFHALPSACLGGRRVQGVRFHRAIPGRLDASGRHTPLRDRGGGYVQPCDQVILALGRKVDRTVCSDLPLDRDGLIRANRLTRRVRDRLFAGGDAVGGEQTIVAAVRDGKRAARAIAVSLGVVRPGRGGRSIHRGGRRSNDRSQDDPR